MIKTCSQLEENIIESGYAQNFRKLLQKPI